jgi:hypothetical protein
MTVEGRPDLPAGMIKIPDIEDKKRFERRNKGEAL